jgi:hypothetical protein
MVSLPYFDIIFLLVVGLLQLGLAMYFFWKYVRTPTILTFGFVVLSISGWVLTNGIGLWLPRDGVAIDFIFRSSYLFAVFIFPLLYLFVLQFTYVTVITWRHITALLIPPVILSALIYGSNNLVIGFSNGSRVDVLFGGDFWVYTFYLLFMFTLILYELFRSIKKSEGLRRWQLNMFFLGTLGSGVIGLSMNLIFPIVGWLVPNWIGPGFSFVWLGFVWRIIAK